MVSRSNPYKRKLTNRTILICGEGDSEECLLKQLQNLFKTKKEYRIKVINAHGGSTLNTVNFVLKYPGDFQSKIVLVDGDRPKSENNLAKQKANSKNIKYLENKPCVEALILSIYFKNDKYHQWLTTICKKEVKKLVKDKKIKELNEFVVKNFTKPKINQFRAKIKNSVLSELISIMEGDV